ncbi:MAG: SurA N-terminal domain-containing protein, partial [Elusimicrobia bacterium]|nr:SurA N-terminal domain-containing protein [Elusimicrobiota bacterium]
LHRHRYTIFLISAGSLLLGAFVGFGGSLVLSSQRGEIVAKVNGQKIPMRLYTLHLERALEQLRQGGQEPSEEAIKQRKGAVLSELLQQEVFYQEAQRLGIKVSDAEVASLIHQVPTFQRKGQFDQQAYFYALRYGLRMTPEEFEQEQRRQMAVFKLRQLLLTGVKITDREVEAERRRRASSRKKQDEESTLDREALRSTLQQEKAVHVLNEWARQLNQRTRLQVFLDELGGNTS